MKVKVVRACALQWDIFVPGLRAAPMRPSVRRADRVGPLTQLLKEIRSTCVCALHAMRRCRRAESVSQCAHMWIT